MFVKYVGLAAETVALAEAFRQSPEQGYDSILRQCLTTLRELCEAPVSVVRGVGCDLGQGALLGQEERIYCFLHIPKAGKQAVPDGSAVARDGALFVDGQRVVPKRGAWLQEALRLVQTKAGHVSKKNGGLVSLDAWEHWFVMRDGQSVVVSKLRSEVRRRKRRPPINLEGLGLL